MWGDSNKVPYKLFFVPGPNGCEFCNEPHIRVCEFNFDEEDRYTINDIIAELKGTKNLVLNMMICDDLNRMNVANFIEQIDFPSEDEESVEKKTLSIYDCLDEFSKEEQLDKDNMWLCEKCKEKVQAIKNLGMSKVPPILIIQLNRFVHDIYSNTRKVESFIDYPVDEFNLEKYVHGPDIEKAHYNLVVVTNQYGAANDGHYTVSFQDDSKTLWFAF